MKYSFKQPLPGLRAKKQQHMTKWLGVADQLQQGAIKGILIELWANG